MVRKHQRNEKKFGVLKQSTKRKIRATKLRRNNDEVFVVKLEPDFDHFEKSSEKTIDFSTLSENRGSS